MEHFMVLVATQSLQISHLFFIYRCHMHIFFLKQDDGNLNKNVYILPLKESNMLLFYFHLYSMVCNPTRGQFHE